MKKILLLFLLITTLNFSKENVRAVSTSQFTTEMLLAIGAENQILGTAYLDDEILPELREKYNKIPVLSKGAPTKEQFYSLNPNFLTGWKSIATPKNLGTVEELKENGIEVVFTKSQDSSKIEDIYSDILMFGDIFNLKDNAKNVVKNMKEDINKVKEKNKNKNNIKVFAYDSQESAPFVVGGNGIGNTMIEIAGGENIFKDTNFSFGIGTWEKVLDENPEAIIVIDYGSVSYENKIKYLKNNSPISQLEAVKKNKFIRIPLSYISPGIKVSKGIEIISNGLREEKK
ncbi:MAG: ABC transporter substrate-binding protein [Cetobacterium sp.]|uniref:ABC transporter substrate-binding protein n=1 Tax=Cetobacterium TaxID=180162 RepID=UPI001F069A47|nr:MULTISPECIES: ABC transporter substrate-binding protein [Cetobacterium]MCX3068249.1 ABC transporter substrate-binding protein [Cetobacterium somerae]UPO97266.1 ABC transporter substrate-binding protein [Cetobacterium somerae]